MNGHELISEVTEAPTMWQAAEIAKSAPPAALTEAADLLYIDGEGHARSFLVKAVVREARA